jgi:hypothetical protein
MKRKGRAKMRPREENPSQGHGDQRHVIPNAAPFPEPYRACQVLRERASGAAVILRAMYRSRVGHLPRLYIPRRNQGRCAALGLRQEMRRHKIRMGNGFLPKRTWPHRVPNPMPLLGHYAKMLKVPHKRADCPDHDNSPRHQCRGFLILTHEKITRQTRNPWYRSPELDPGLRPRCGRHRHPRVGQHD